MNAVEYLKAKARFCTGICNICPLNSNNNEEKLYCDDLEIERPELAVEIVEKWAKENPVKTYKDVFLEKFPNATMGEDGCPTCCPTSLFNIEQECPKIPCVKCWNREYKEEANEN